MGELKITFSGQVCGNCGTPMGEHVRSGPLWFCPTDPPDRAPTQEDKEREDG